MRVVFMGSPGFAVPCLRAVAGAHEVVLVVTQPDKPAGRGGQMHAPAVKTCALELGLPVIQPRSAKTGELRDAMAQTGADVAVVVAYGKILPAPVLTVLPRGCINVHASILPKYRGAAPVQWAVIDGEPETGVCIMQLDEGMDTGPVLAEKRVTIGPAETSGELLERLAPIGAAACLEVLAHGDWHPVPQDPAGATHARMLVKADGAIDFSRPAVEVCARIRGVDPWPGAYATHKDQPLKLFRAVAHARPPGTEAPGTVIAVDARGAHVACGSDVAIIGELQAPGRKRLTAQQLAQGRGIAIGDVLVRPTA